MQKTKWRKFVGPFVATVEQVGNRYIARFYSISVFGTGDCDPEDCLHAWHSYDRDLACRRAHEDLRALNRQRWLPVQQLIVARRVIEINRAVLDRDIVTAVRLWECVWNAIDRSCASDTLFEQLRSTTIGCVENLAEV